MLFWSSLHELNGPATQRISITGKFAYEASDGRCHPQGRTRVVTSLATEGRVFLGDAPHPKSEGMMWSDSGDIYWLPWRNGEVTQATYADMDALGCTFFMTSLFTGCRFVATETKVAHIAFSQGALGNNTLGRDLGELTSMHTGPLPVARRKLTIDGTNGIDWGTHNNVTTSYGSGVTNMPDGSGGTSQVYQGQAVVLGYKSDRVWRFKTLINQNGNYVWSTLV
ncbi:MAG: hypothetical protein WBB95_21235 [Pseudomonas sp.]|uniref:hypothetical protein n=1 Tax=Pseudomonas sp. TaxID=306 RepID=UPI003C76939A